MLTPLPVLAAGTFAADNAHHPHTSEHAMQPDAHFHWLVHAAGN